MEEDFPEFMRQCRHRLFRVAYLLTADPGRAEELTQDALVRTYRAWHRIRDDDAYGYARRVLVNLHTDWWRARRWLELATSRVPDRAGEPDPADRTVARDSMARALQRLSRRERAVIVHRYYLDLTERQTALELGVTVGTVKSMTARALAKLRIDRDLTADRPVVPVDARTTEEVD